MQSKKEDNSECFKDLIKQNYEITLQRGLITDETTHKDFEMKLLEEMLEVAYEDTFNGIALELADIILVCFNYATNMGIDIEQALKEKIEINRKRIQ